MGSVHTVRRSITACNRNVYNTDVWIIFKCANNGGLGRRVVILTAHQSHTIAGPHKGPAKPTKSLQEITCQQVVHTGIGTRWDILVLALGGAYWYWH